MDSLDVNYKNTRTNNTGAASNVLKNCGKSCNSINFHSTLNHNGLKKFKFRKCTDHDSFNDPYQYNPSESDGNTSSSSSFDWDNVLELGNVLDKQSVSKIKVKKNVNKKMKLMCHDESISIEKGHIQPVIKNHKISLNPDNLESEKSQIYLQKRFKNTIDQKEENNDWSKKKISKKHNIIQQKIRTNEKLSKNKCRYPECANDCVERKPDTNINELIPVLNNAVGLLEERTNNINVTIDNKSKKNKHKNKRNRSKDIVEFIPSLDTVENSYVIGDNINNDVGSVDDHHNLSLSKNKVNYKKFRNKRKLQTKSLDSDSTKNNHHKQLFSNKEEGLKAPNNYNAESYEIGKMPTEHLSHKPNDHDSLYSLVENESYDKSPSQCFLEEVMDKIHHHMTASEEELQKIKNLNIHITWKLPLLHVIDDGSQKNFFNKLKVKLGSKHKELSTKKFTKKEEKKIIKNWKKFSKMYKFENPQLFIWTKQQIGKFPKEERLKFKQFLAKGLPDRRLYSVYRKFADIFGVTSKGRWTKKEDRLLLWLYNAYDEQNGEEKYKMPRFIMLQKALGRSWMSVHRRLQLLQQDEHTRRVHQLEINWTPELEGQIIHYLLKYSKCDSLEKLRYSTIPFLIWNKVATKLNLFFDRLVDHWKYHLYPHLFTRKSVLRHHLHIELISWFFKSGITDWADINWGKLSKKSGDLGSCFLYRSFRTLVSNNVPKKLHKDLKACVLYLRETWLSRALEKENSQIIKRWLYNPETRLVEVIDEDVTDCVYFRLD